MDVLAVDWSGDARHAERGIRLARARPGRLLDVVDGLDRTRVVDRLIDAATTGPLVVGLDFSFGLPAWFARDRGCQDIDELWDVVRVDGERWLAACADPFWGRPGTRQPPEDPDRSRWRRTEQDARDLGLQPKSTFQIGGAGAVGTGSLRGMPELARLRAAGFAVWPFDDAGPATALEIYPSVWTAGARGVPVLRRARIAQDTRIPAELHDAVAASEHAFDAAFSALAMAEHVDELGALEAARAGSAAGIEGRIWLPGTVTGVPPRRPAPRGPAP